MRRSAQLDRPGKRPAQQTATGLLDTLSETHWVRKGWRRACWTELQSSWVGGSSRGIESDCWPCPVTSPCDWRPAYSVPRGTVRTGSCSTQRSHGYLTPDRIPCGGWGQHNPPRNPSRARPKSLRFTTFSAKEVPGHRLLRSWDVLRIATRRWKLVLVRRRRPGRYGGATNQSLRAALWGTPSRRQQHQEERRAVGSHPVPVIHPLFRPRRALAFGHCPKFPLLAHKLCARPSTPVAGLRLSCAPAPTAQK